jgi:enediyne biosynthesis protein E4
VRSRIGQRLAVTVLSAAVSLGFIAPAIAGRRPSSSKQTAKRASAAGAIHFEDITRAAGIRFVHNNGAFGKKWLPETMGPGVGFIDYNNDGWQDILFVNGTDWPGHHVHGATTPALYRNNHDGTFTDVTKQAGLAVSMYGMGVTIGDYDNDGYDDIFITGYGQNHLFHNNGNGTFTDVTKKAGLGGTNDLSTSAAWVDYDRDGHLDLLVANYVEWSPDKDLFCTMDGKTKSYCTPESYHGTSVRLWHNNGDGTFTDVTKKAGLYDTTSKSLGIAVFDANRDGWPDIAISNDTQPNKLYVNNRNGTFTEKGVPAGIGFSEDGVARAGMGIDAADFDRSGYPSLVITNFSNQMMALYHNEKNGLFVDEAPQTAVGRDSLLTLGFGCFFFDYDLDGWLDMYVVNGHIDPQIERVAQRVHYAEPPHLFRNLDGHRFEDVAAAMGKSFDEPRVGRGAAYGDINNDGAPDIAVTTNGGPAALFVNRGVRNNGLRIKLVGTKSNRDGIGTEATVTAGKDRQTRTLSSGSSYLSSNELILTFGLASHSKADAIELRWPSGQVDHLSNVTANQIITIKEGQGIIAAKPFAKR